MLTRQVVRLQRDLGEAFWEVENLVRTLQPDENLPIFGKREHLKSTSLDIHF